MTSAYEGERLHVTRRGDARGGERTGATWACASLEGVGGRNDEERSFSFCLATVGFVGKLDAIRQDRVLWHLWDGVREGTG